RRAPKRIGAGDLTEELAHVLADQRSAGLPSSAHARPVITKAFALPRNGGLRPNEDQRFPPPCPATRQPGPKDATFGSNARSLDRSLVDRQLMSQSDVLDS